MNSYWISSTENSDFEGPKPIDKDYIADVCVIGAGISGLSTGYYLAKQGLKVVIIDKDGIGKKASGHTTAKITLNHGLIYDYLINSFGADFAFKYFEANKNAISNIKNIIDSENIDCDFEYRNNYIYTTEQNDLPKIHNEIKALNTLDRYIKDAKITDANETSQNTKNSESFAQFVVDCGLPFKIAGAMETKNQAQFHPRKYMLGLANAVKNYGGLIFTNSLVHDVKKADGGYISYSKEHSIYSKYVVLASHYPIINFPGFYFSKMYQVSSYALGIETDKKLFDGMYINAGEPVLSLRTAKYGDKRLLILAGGNHKTGYSPDSEEFYGYKFLEKQAKKFFPDGKVLYRWNTRDCVGLDKVPYIGEFSEFMPKIYVATGFNKWGMTSSNIAANIISDNILGKENKYADIYNSKRMEPIKNRGEVKNVVGQVFKSFVVNRIKIPEEDVSAIKNDNGGIIRINATSVGIYKDPNGKTFAVNPTCSHLGCLLTWNNVDKTWDCPCHGSRFDYTGKNLYDPAFKDLDTYELN